MEIETRTFGRTELAQLYSPDLTAEAAWRKLKRWIALNGDLTARLAELGYTHSQRTFTPKMVEHIFHYLGEP